MDTLGWGPGVTNDLWLGSALPSLIDTALLSPAREAWAPITSYRRIKVCESKVWLWEFPSCASRKGRGLTAKRRKNLGRGGVG